MCLLLFSCKEPDKVGLEQIKGEKLKVTYNDSTKIIAYSVKEDSVKTNSVTSNLVGSIFDPVFGLTTASFYTQFQLTTTNVTFGDNPQVDSLVLTLAYDGYYGDTTLTQTVNVYEISDDLSTTTDYYSHNDNSKNKKINYYNTVIGSKTFLPRPKDSIYVNAVNGKKVAQKYAPHLRIKLSPEFAQKFINASGTSNLANNTNFVSFFKGLYLTANPVKNGGCIMYFNLLLSLSQMTFYYRYNNSSIPDTTSLNFIINSNCAKFSYYNHNYTPLQNPTRIKRIPPPTNFPVLNDQQFIKQVMQKDTLLGNQILYLQSMGGVKTKILLPDLKNLTSNGKIAIDKAELILRINSTEPTNVKYVPPPQLELLRIESDGTSAFIPDYLMGSEYYGGTYDSLKLEYRFRISVYIQDLFNGKITGDKGMYLIINGASDNAQRIVLNGIKPLPPENHRIFTLQITYTNLGISK